ncbi:MAG: hypothetical protein Q9168_004336 [Polycauliona sp. 1 TL-2023]
MTFQRFTEDLSNAFKGCFPTSAKPYKRVIAIFVYWDNFEEDCPDSFKQTTNLSNLFEQEFNFTCKHIVVCKSWASRYQRNSVAQTILEYGIMANNDDDLVIFLYGGCSGLQAANGHTWIASNFEATNNDVLDLTVLLHDTLSHNASDVVYLIDGCCTSSIALRPGEELLASSAVEIPSPDMSFSMTRQIHDMLLEQQSRPITIAQIHAKILQHAYQYYGRDIKSQLRVIPVHPELNVKQKGSIVLAPLNPSNDSTLPDPYLQVLPTASLLHPDGPKVLISVHLSDVHTIQPTLDSWMKWLSAIRPPYIRDTETSVVSVHTTYTSTLVLFEVPAAVHSSMRGHPAYQMTQHCSHYTAGPILRSTIIVHRTKKPLTPVNLFTN